MEKDQVLDRYKYHCSEFCPGGIFDIKHEALCAYFAGEILQLRANIDRFELTKDELKGVLGLVKPEEWVKIVKVAKIGPGEVDSGKNLIFTCEASKKLRQELGKAPTDSVFLQILRRDSYNIVVWELNRCSLLTTALSKVSQINGTDESKAKELTKMSIDLRIEVLDEVEELYKLDKQWRNKASSTIDSIVKDIRPNIRLSPTFRSTMCWTGILENDVKPKAHPDRYLQPWEFEKEFESTFRACKDEWKLVSPDGWKYAGWELESWVLA